jgi:valyl-tRNA synthetase
MSELPKTFDPKTIEERWYAHWESRGLFRPDRPEAKPWTIVMPPPNVTGSLHIGHALDNTLQDILTRRERMLGKDALWVVGTDHAGIATQMVVERNLESQQIKRAEIGREAFLEHVWEWKAQSGGAATGRTSDSPWTSATSAPSPTPSSRCTSAASSTATSAS